MSAVYKRLGREDSFVIPYTAHKTFTFTSSSFSDNGIHVNAATSGSFPYNEEAIRYAGVEQMFFNSNEYPTRTLGTSATTLEIPRELYGRSILPGSFTLTTTNVQPNQFDFDVYDSNGSLIESSSGDAIGYIDYSKGLCVFSEGDYADTNLFPTIQETVANSLSEIAYPLGYKYEDILTADYSTPNEVVIPSTVFSDGAVIDWNTLNPDLHPVIHIRIGGIDETREVTNVQDLFNGTYRVDYIGDPIDGNLLETSYLEYYKNDIVTTRLTSHIVLATQGVTWPTDIDQYEQADYNGTSIASIVRVNDYTINVSPITFEEDDRSAPFTATLINRTTTEANYTASFDSTVDIHTYNFNCILDPNELNQTYNPTVLLNDSGSLESFATGSDFRPYVTSVGIYNEANELLAIGKLGQPTPILPDTPYTFVVQIDI